MLAFLAGFVGHMTWAPSALDIKLATRDLVLDQGDDMHNPHIHTSLMQARTGDLRRAAANAAYAGLASGRSSSLATSSRRFVAHRAPRGKPRLRTQA